MRLLVLFTAGCILVAGCENLSKSTDQSDPVEQFKSLVFFGAGVHHWRVDSSPLVSRVNSCDCTADPSDISIDVQKTDSLITPLVGEVRFAVKQTYDDGRSRTRWYKKSYVYQDKRWKLDMSMIKDGDEWKKVFWEYDVRVIEEWSDRFMLD